MNFKEKKILITGGSSGIGKAIISELTALFLASADSSFITGSEI